MIIYVLSAPDKQSSLKISIIVLYVDWESGRWLTERETMNWIWLATLLSLAMFVGSLILLPFLIVRLPADYFLRKPVRDWPTRHPAVHLTIVIVKNVLGAILVLAGFAMLVLPGQGLLTILMGVALLDVPGKRHLERRIVQIKPVRQAANWIRNRYGRKPLQFDHEPISENSFVP